MYQYRIIDNLDISAEELEALVASLPEWRREAAMKFKHVQGRKENALSFNLLREMLGYEPQFGYGTHGKPHDETSAMHFNISHCKNAIGVIISDREVGIDVECLGRYKPELVEYAMSNDELNEIETGGDTAFTVLWTKKEALLKLTGEGITDDLKTVLTSDRIKNVIIESGYDKEKNYAWSIAYLRGDDGSDADRL